MILYEPFPRSAITQGFSENATETYKKNGLIGHTTLDYGGKCGDSIYNCARGFCYSVMNKDNANLDKYRAVFILVEDGEFVYELSYGHLDKIYAVPGTWYGVGDVIGTLGNTGEVYMNGKRVTNEIRAKVPCAGGHLHGVQVRKCRKVSKVNPKKKYLSDANGTYVWNGSYIEIVNYWNGLNGCVNPMDFYNGILASTVIQNMKLQVSLLTKVVSLLKMLRGVVK